MPTLAAWGRIALSGFDADVDDTRLDGEVTTGIVGADAEWDRMLVGVAASYSKGDGAFVLTSGKASNRERGEVDSTLASVYPYGATSHGAERLWSLGDARDLVTDGGFDAGRRLEAELGYGMRALAGYGVVTPYTGLSLSDGGRRAMRLGARWMVGPDIALRVEARRNEGPYSTSARELRLRATARW